MKLSKIMIHMLAFIETEKAQSIYTQSLVKSIIDSISTYGDPTGTRDGDPTGVLGVGDSISTYGDPTGIRDGDPNGVLEVGAGIPDCMRAPGTTQDPGSPSSAWGTIRRVITVRRLVVY